MDKISRQVVWTVADDSVQLMNESFELHPLKPKKNLKRLDKTQKNSVKATNSAPLHHYLTGWKTMEGCHDGEMVRGWAE